MLDPGTTAPDFILTDHHGAPWRLSAQRGRPVVLFFYPHNATPGCKGEVCGFRDQYEDFLALGAAVVGINATDEASQRRFAELHQLPFPLLADVGGRVRRLYDVPRLYGFLPLQARVTYVLDGGGQIQLAFNSNRNPVEHVGRALAALRAG